MSRKLIQTGIQLRVISLIIFGLYAQWTIFNGRKLSNHVKMKVTLSYKIFHMTTVTNILWHLSTHYSYKPDPTYLTPQDRTENKSISFRLMLPLASRNEWFTMKMKSLVVKQAFLYYTLLVLLFYNTLKGNSTTW